MNLQHDSMIKVIAYSNGNKAEIILTREDCINKLFKPVLANAKYQTTRENIFYDMISYLEGEGNVHTITFPFNSDKNLIDLELNIYEQIKDIQNDKWRKLFVLLLMMALGAIIYYFIEAS